MKNEVCHVGFTASTGDRLRFIKVMTFLEAVRYSTRHWRMINHDAIDLNTSARDFLAEDFDYSIVVLHFLWRPSRLDHIAPILEMSASPLHSWSAWRSRLLKTKARYIFPFGGTTEINGSFIAHLEGYELYGPEVIAFRTDGFDVETDFWCLAGTNEVQPETTAKFKHYKRKALV